jgi:hypothetical protein
MCRPRNDVSAIGTYVDTWSKTSLAVSKTFGVEVIDVEAA